MTRLSVTIDDGLLKEARELSGAKTKREAIERALTEYVERRRLERLIELEGSDIIDMDLDELLAWRRASIDNYPESD